MAGMRRFGHAGVAAAGWTEPCHFGAWFVLFRILRCEAVTGEAARAEICRGSRLGLA